MTLNRSLLNMKIEQVNPAATNTLHGCSHPKAFEVIRAAFSNVPSHRDRQSSHVGHPRFLQGHAIPLHGINQRIQFYLIETYGCWYRRARTKI